jgi:hypothetical protein
MEALDALAKIEINQGYRSDLVSNTKEVSEVKTRGDTTGYAMRRLAKDAPALHAQVIAGELLASHRDRLQDSRIPTYQRCSWRMGLAYWTAAWYDVDLQSDRGINGERGDSFGSHPSFYWSRYNQLQSLAPVARATRARGEPYQSARERIREHNRQYRERKRQDVS